jgi:hypothetical protein
MQRLQPLFEQFLRERVYVNNITPATREWYECAWKAFSTTLTDRTAPAPVITKADLQNFVIALRERGVNAGVYVDRWNLRRNGPHAGVLAGVVRDLVQINLASSDGPVVSSIHVEPAAG